MAIDLRSPTTTRSIMPDTVIYTLRFTPQSTSTPTDLIPSAAGTLARTGTGTYTITLDDSIRPKAGFGIAGIEAVTEDSRDIQFISYVASTGVITVQATNKNTGAAEDLANTRRVRVIFFGTVVQDVTV